MQKPTLYIMCGLPYSGKTVLAKAISEKHGFPIVSIDDIREERGFNWENNEQVTAEDWKSIFKESRQRILKLLEEGKNVIYDSANQDRASRDSLRALAEKGDYPTKVIFIHIPLSIIFERCHKNQETKERFHLPEKWLQAAIDTLEKPTEEEEVLYYNQSEGLDGWIKESFS